MTYKTIEDFVDVKTDSFDLFRKEGWKFVDLTISDMYLFAKEDERMIIRPIVEDNKLMYEVYLIYKDLSYR